MVNTQMMYWRCWREIHEHGRVVYDVVVIFGTQNKFVAVYKCIQWTTLR